MRSARVQQACGAGAEDVCDVDAETGSMEKTVHRSSSPKAPAGKCRASCCSGRESSVLRGSTPISGVVV